MYKNKNFFIALFLLVFLGNMLVSIPETNAQGFNYQLLEKIPGKEAIGGNDLSKYITAIYDTALVIVVLSAVLMASIGGFMYLTSAGNTAAMGTAKGVIFDAVIGLVIALAAWLLLNVINPDLVNVKIKSLSVISTPGAPGTPTEGAPVPVPSPGAAWPDDSDIRKRLTDAGIDFNKDNCKTEGQTDRCTSVAGLGEAAVNGLIKLKKDCGCSVTISGGTEYWFHGNGKPESTTHRQGNSVVDIRLATTLDTYLRSSATLQCSIKDRPVYRLNGADYWYEDALHWHVNYGQTICK